VPDFDFIDWDDEDDPRGNVRHIDANGITVVEFEEVLNDPATPTRSRSSGRPAKVGWTSTGKHIIVVYEVEDDGGFVIARPVTAYAIEP
jgi:hypothetical protein